MAGILRRTGLAAVAIALLFALVPRAAWADSDAVSARVEAPAQPVELAALLLPAAAPIDTGMAAITVGRGQDIVGTPIDFARIRRPTTGGLSASLRNLPSHVAVPTRLPLQSAVLTSRHGMRWHPIRGGYRVHQGIDLAAPAGSPIYAPAGGVISMAGWAGGYGLAVTIEHGGGLETRYGHMLRLAVTNGQTVTAGSIIGYVGSTGLSTGPHLHYEVRSNGQSIDPLQGRR